MTFKSNVPNLFVIGVPKAGTTSLFRWLGDHPEIGKSTENELRFLMDENDPLCRADGYNAQGLDGYARFYNDRRAENGTKYLIDVSPQYYYQDTALSVIGDLADSQVIMLLRKPSARIYSLFNYSKNNKAALRADMAFSEFVGEIRRGDDSDVLRGRPMLQYAIQHSEYAAYVQKWRAVVGADRLKIYLFEDLVQDSNAVLRQIASDLGVSPDFYETYGFPAQNKSFALRHRGLHKLLHKSRKKLPHWVRQTLKPVYLRLNTRAPDRTSSEDDRHVLNQLDADFIESELELAKLLGRDGPIWSMPNQSAVGKTGS